MQKEVSPKLNIRPAVERVLRQLPERNRDILASRFGIGKESRETLESIGQRYNITRERVRQIEEASIAKLRTMPEFKELNPVFEEIAKYLDERGGVMREDKLLVNLVPKAQAPHLSLVLSLGSTFVPMKENDLFHPAWATGAEHIRKVQGVLKDVVASFESDPSPIIEEDIVELMKEKGAAHEKDYSVSANALHHVNISKLIAQGPFMDYGLRYWPEISPRGVRDKAYLVFEKEGTPLHFRTIAEKIDEFGFTKKSKKRTHHQTVHNELIKDERFVLVGRGMYALVKWGYKPGTVRDVLVSVLKEAQKPLPREELLRRVLRQRMVQENTILLNLQNKKYFRRNDGGEYSLTA